ncbi:sensor histidine kinase [Streptomyces celluloflavus]|uniref:sensor histidine kinase n=1 Tax=Streptomyces celluloflavus TaxID=58344 RepID=UPI0036B3A263
MPTAFPQGTQTPQEAPRSPRTESFPGAASIPSSARRREREGGRHGRASFPGSAADSAIRSRTVRLVTVPCLLTAVTCVAVTAFVVGSGDVRLTGREWAALTGGLAVICIIVLTAGAAAHAASRATVTRYARLRQVCARSRSDLDGLLDQVRRGERLQHRDPEPGPVRTGDTLDLLAAEVAAVGRAAETAVIDAVAAARCTANDSEQKVEVFVNLARRLQSLVHREIEMLDELEHQVEDPDLLKGLFHVDHLATRIRRHAENLAVLGGAVSRRQWSRPVTMIEVLRSAIAEVEQYPRIKLVPPTEGTLRGHAVADVIHLLAELIENASVYSAPRTSVLLRAQQVTAGLAVEVEDRGLGMSPDERTRMNALLADPEHIDVDALLSDGRIGLFVVSSLARRHGIVVRLQSNIYGGVQAVLILPPELIGTEPAGAGSERGTAPTESPDAGPDHEHGGGPGDGHRTRHHLGRGGTGSPSGPAPELAPAAAHHGAARPAAGPPADPGTGMSTGADADRGTDTGGQPAAPHRAAPTGAPAYAPQAQSAPYVTAAPATRQLTPAYPADGPEYHRAVEERPAEPGPAGLPPAPHDAPDAPAPPGGIRPQLPRRRKQEHLVPELRGDPILPSAVRRTGPEPMHDPGLMAAFRRGISLAADTSDENHPAAHPDGGTGNTPGPDGDHPLHGRDHDTPTARLRGDDHNHGE